MNTLFKPNGKEVQVNDNSLAYALSIGWAVEDPTKEVEVIEEVTEEVAEEVIEVEVEKKEPTKKKANKKAD